jgi:hypothetical protein
MDSTIYPLQSDLNGTGLPLLPEGEKGHFSQRRRGEKRGKEGLLAKSAK